MVLDTNRTVNVNIVATGDKDVLKQLQELKQPNSIPVEIDKKEIEKLKDKDNLKVNIDTSGLDDSLKETIEALNESINSLKKLKDIKLLKPKLDTSDLISSVNSAMETIETRVDKFGEYFVRTIEDSIKGSNIDLYIKNKVAAGIKAGAVGKVGLEVGDLATETTELKENAEDMRKSMLESVKALRESVAILKQELQGIEITLDTEAVSDSIYNAIVASIEKAASEGMSVPITIQGNVQYTKPNKPPKPPSDNGTPVKPEPTKPEPESKEPEKPPKKPSKSSKKTESKKPEEKKPEEPKEPEKKTTVAGAFKVGKPGEKDATEFIDVNNDDDIKPRKPQKKPRRVFRKKLDENGNPVLNEEGKVVWEPVFNVPKRQRGLSEELNTKGDDKRNAKAQSERDKARAKKDLKDSLAMVKAHGYSDLDEFKQEIINSGGSEAVYDWFIKNHSDSFFTKENKPNKNIINAIVKGFTDKKKDVNEFFDKSFVRVGSPNDILRDVYTPAEQNFLHEYFDSDEEVLGDIFQEAGSFKQAQKDYTKSSVLNLVDEFLGNAKGTTKELKNLNPVTDWVKFGWGTENEANKNAAVKMLDKINLLRVSKEAALKNVEQLGIEGFPELTDSELSYVFGSKVGWQNRFNEIYQPSGFVSLGEEQKIRQEHPEVTKKPEDNGEHIRIVEPMSAEELFRANFPTLDAELSGSGLTITQKWILAYADRKDYEEQKNMFLDMNKHPKYYPDYTKEEQDAADKEKEKKLKLRKFKFNPKPTEHNKTLEDKIKAEQRARNLQFPENAIDTYVNADDALRESLEHKFGITKGSIGYRAWIKKEYKKSNTKKVNSKVGVKPDEKPVEKTIEAAENKVGIEPEKQPKTNSDIKKQTDAAFKKLIGRYVKGRLNKENKETLRGFHDSITSNIEENDTTYKYLYGSSLTSGPARELKKRSNYFSDSDEAFEEYDNTMRSIYSKPYQWFGGKENAPKYELKGNIGEDEYKYDKTNKEIYEDILGIYNKHINDIQNEVERESLKNSLDYIKKLSDKNPNGHDYRTYEMSNYLPTESTRYWTGDVDEHGKVFEGASEHGLAFIDEINKYNEEYTRRNIIGFAREYLRKNNVPENEIDKELLAYNFVDDKFKSMFGLQVPNYVEGNPNWTPEEREDYIKKHGPVDVMMDTGYYLKEFFNNYSSEKPSKNEPRTYQEWIKQHPLKAAEKPSSPLEEIQAALDEITDEEMLTGGEVKLIDKLKKNIANISKESLEEMIKYLGGDSNAKPDNTFGDLSKFSPPLKRVFKKTIEEYLNTPKEEEEQPDELQALIDEYNKVVASIANSQDPDQVKPQARTRQENRIKKLKARRDELDAKINALKGKAPVGDFQFEDEDIKTLTDSFNNILNGLDTSGLKHTNIYKNTITKIVKTINDNVNEFQKQSTVYTDSFRTFRDIEHQNDTIFESDISKVMDTLGKYFYELDYEGTPIRHDDYPLLHLLAPPDDKTKAYNYKKVRPSFFGRNGGIVYGEYEYEEVGDTPHEERNITTTAFGKKMTGSASTSIYARNHPEDEDSELLSKYAAEVYNIPGLFKFFRENAGVDIDKFKEYSLSYGEDAFALTKAMHGDEITPENFESFFQEALAKMFESIDGKPVSEEGDIPFDEGEPEETIIPINDFIEKIKDNISSWSEEKLIEFANNIKTFLETRDIPNEDFEGKIGNWSDDINNTIMQYIEDTLGISAEVIKKPLADTTELAPVEPDNDQLLAEHARMYGTALSGGNKQFEMFNDTEAMKQTLIDVGSKLQNIKGAKSNLDYVGAFGSYSETIDLKSIAADIISYVKTDLPLAKTIGKKKFGFDDEALDKIVSTIGETIFRYMMSVANMSNVTKKNAHNVFNGLFANAIDRFGLSVDRDELQHGTIGTAPKQPEQLPKPEQPKKRGRPKKVKTTALVTTNNPTEPHLDVVGNSLKAKIEALGKELTTFNEELRKLILSKLHLGVDKEYFDKAAAYPGIIRIELPHEQGLQFIDDPEEYKNSLIQRMAITKDSDVGLDQREYRLFKTRLEALNNGMPLKNVKHIYSSPEDSKRDEEKKKLTTAARKKTGVTKKNTNEVKNAALPQTEKVIESAKTKAGSTKKTKEPEEEPLTSDEVLKLILKYNGGNTEEATFQEALGLISAEESGDIANKNLIGLVKRVIAKRARGRDRPYTDEEAQDLFDVFKTEMSHYGEVGQLLMPEGEGLLESYLRHGTNELNFKSILNKARKRFYAPKKTSHNPNAEHVYTEKDFEDYAIKLGRVRELYGEYSEEHIGGALKLENAKKYGDRLPDLQPIIDKAVNELAHKMSEEYKKIFSKEEEEPENDMGGWYEHSKEQTFTGEQGVHPDDSHLLGRAGDSAKYNGKWYDYATGNEWEYTEEKQQKPTDEEYGEIWDADVVEKWKHEFSDKDNERMAEIEELIKDVYNREGDTKRYQEMLGFRDVAKVWGPSRMYGRIKDRWDQSVNEQITGNKGGKEPISIRKDLKKFFGDPKGSIAASMEASKATVWTSFKTAVKMLPATLFLGAVTGIVDLFKKGFNGIFELGKKTVLGSLKPVKMIFNGFVSIFKKAISESKTLSNMIELIVMPFLLLVEFTLMPVLLSIIDPIKKMIDWTITNKENLMDIGYAIGDLIVPFIEDVVDAFSMLDTKNGLVAFVRSGVEAFSSILTGWLDKAKDIYNENKGSIDNLVHTFVENAFYIATSFIKTNSDIVADVVRTATDTLKSLLESDDGKISDALKSVTEAVSAIVDAMVLVLSDPTVMASIVEAITSILEIMMDAVGRVMTSASAHSNWNDTAALINRNYDLYHDTDNWTYAKSMSDLEGSIESYLNLDITLTTEEGHVTGYKVEKTGHYYDLDGNLRSVNIST